MQIMPGTARDFSLKKTEMTDPSRSIETAVKILDRYDKMLESKVANPLELKSLCSPHIMPTGPCV